MGWCVGEILSSGRGDGEGDSEGRWPPWTVGGGVEGRYRVLSFLWVCTPKGLPWNSLLGWVEGSRVSESYGECRPRFLVKGRIGGGVFIFFMSAPPRVGTSVYTTPLRLSPSRGVGQDSGERLPRSRVDLTPLLSVHLRDSLPSPLPSPLLRPRSLTPRPHSSTPAPLGKIKVREGYRCSRDVRVEKL